MPVNCDGKRGLYPIYWEKYAANKIFSKLLSLDSSENKVYRWALSKHTAVYKPGGGPNGEMEPSKNVNVKRDRQILQAKWTSLPPPQNCKKRSVG